jgi:hypothetical protein
MILLPLSSVPACKMARSEESKRHKVLYNIGYKAKTYRRYRLDVRFDNKDVIDKLESVPNRNKYLLDLIKADIDRQKKGE